MRVEFHQISHQVPLQFKNFLSDCTQFLSEKHILTDRKHLIEKSVSLDGSFRDILAWMIVPDKKSLISILKSANKYAIPLYTISTGKNWGFGSHLPVTDSCVILDLSTWNQISDYDPIHGTVEIEPGVTQAQLTQFLNEKQSSFYLDVTGSSELTSVLGNTLERGISYHFMRPQKVAFVEVMLANGETLRTGFGEYTSSQVKNLYSYGIGPGLDSLFFQSNYAIVTKMVYQLSPRPQRQYLVTLPFTDEKLPQVIEQIRYLKQQKVFNSVWHIANRERVLENLNPIVLSALKKHNLQSHQFKTLKFLYKALSLKDWLLTGEVSGAPSVALGKKKEVIRTLKSLGPVKVINKDHLSYLPKILSLMGFKSLAVALKSIHALQALNLGQPTNETLRSLCKATDEIDIHNLDVTARKFSYCTPLAPLTGSGAQQILYILREHTSPSSIAVTLNVISEYILEGVLSLPFDEFQVHELQRKYISSGLNPYRLGISHMELAANPSMTYRKTLKDIKKLLDPNEILSPGRYI